MDIGTIQGTMDRRILVNYRVDPQVLAALLPPPFEPKVIRGAGMAGVCLIRLRHMVPSFVPSLFGLSSENAAHRIAVQWEEAGRLHEGVYIPRRDTSSWLISTIGGRLFPGIHTRVRFDVTEHDDAYHVALDSVDHKTSIRVEARRTASLPDTSVFASLSEASTFFEKESLGYSSTGIAGCYDVIELRTFNWEVSALKVETVESSFFDDRSIFPAASITFDSALLMRNIKHEWHSHGQLVRPNTAFNAF